MLLVNLRKVLESEALSRSELVGFLVALFIEEDGRLQDLAMAAEARKLLSDLRPLDHSTQIIWLEALNRMDCIYNLPQI